jgi:hypothetical protein
MARLAVKIRGGYEDAERKSDETEFIGSWAYGIRVVV